jgi:hypothetical protein
MHVFGSWNKERNYERSANSVNSYFKERVDRVRFDLIPQKILKYKLKVERHLIRYKDS